MDRMLRVRLQNTRRSGGGDQAAERLFSQDLLIKDDTGTAYGFKMDLWRQWVRRMHSTWQVQDEISGDDRLDQLGILPAGTSGGKKPWRR